MKLTKIASLVLAIALVFSLGITAFAAEKGSITINGASNTNTYEIYKILDLESYNVTDGKYAYKVNSVWDDFFATDAAKEYFTVDTQGYATWTNVKDDDDTVAAFAKLALEYAKANSIPPVASSNTPTENKIVFSNLDLGYYLIDSTMGALCGLTTTNPHASINAKNAAPTIDKQVKEDSTGNWGEGNTAEIGQKVEYRVTIVTVQLVRNSVTSDVAESGNFSVATGSGDGCTFEVIFTKAFCDSLETNDKVLIYYSAVINEDAVIGAAGDNNTVKLDFGEDHETSVDTAVTHTYAFDIVKTDSQNKLIDGAEFRIYDAEEDGNEIKVVKISDTLYRRAKPSEEGIAVAIAVKDGKVRVEGFDNGTYYLEETKTPEGYNQLAARQAFTISDGNLDATSNGEIYSTGSGVHVVNKNGTMLPETGGIGTTLFYVVGGILVAGSLVFLVTKKRMGNR